MNPARPGGWNQTKMERPRMTRIRADKQVELFHTCVYGKSTDEKKLKHRGTEDTEDEILDLRFWIDEARMNDRSNKFNLRKSG
jgi:hypothetical protein